MFRPTKGWGLTALLAVLPLTAILHHRVFFPPTCILQPLHATDYGLRSVRLWLSSDPSPSVALTIAIVVYLIGRFDERIRRPTLAFAIAFMPLAIWIWDVPLTGRIVCRLLHDGRAGLHTRHFFALGAFAWPMVLLWQSNRRSATSMASVGLVEVRD